MGTLQLLLRELPTPAGLKHRREEKVPGAGLFQSEDREDHGLWLGTI